MSQVLVYDLLEVQDRLGSEDLGWPGAVDAAAQVFLKYIDLFKTYKDYVSTAVNRLALLRKITQSRSSFDKFIQSVRINLQKCHIYDDLVSLLCRPSRQATVYLQAFELLKTEVPESKPVADTLAKVKDVLRVIGTTDSAKMLEFHRLHELQERIEGRVNLLAPHRAIEYEETVTLIEEATDNELEGSSGSPGGLQSLLPKTKLHLVLMNDSLLITESTGTRSTSSLVFERLVPLLDVAVVFTRRSQAVAGAPPASTSAEDRRARIFRFEVFGFVYAVKCASVHNRELWESRVTRCQLALQKSQEGRMRASRQSLVSTPSSPALAVSVPQPSEASGSKAQQQGNRLISRLRSTTLRNTIQDTMIDYKDKIHLVLEILGQVKGESFTPTPVSKRMPLFVGSNGAILGREMPSGKPLGTLKGAEQRAGFLLVPDEAVSRQHCLVAFSSKERKFYIRDLGSANNTFVLRSTDGGASSSVTGNSGQRLAEPTGTATPAPGYALTPGCIFQIGSTRIRIEAIQTEEISVEDGPSSPRSSTAAQNALDRQRSNSASGDATMKSVDAKSNVLFKLGLLDASDSSADLQQEDNRAPKRIEVFVKQEMRGLALVYPRKNFMALRSQIFRLLLTDGERDAVGSNWKSLPLKLNDRLAVLPSQNKIIAYDAVEKGDKITVTIS